MRNIAALQEFHQLCTGFGIRPTYLVTYWVSKDPGSIDTLLDLQSKGNCEIAAHPHLWEIEPHHEIEKQFSHPVGNSYPQDILAEKLERITSSLTEHFGPIHSHRAGRWGFCPTQARILERLGYSSDSSVTPGIDWSSTGAPNYSDFPREPYWLTANDVHLRDTAGLLEIPCTVLKNSHLERLRWSNLRSVVRQVLGRSQSERWLRILPRGSTSDLLRLCHDAKAVAPHLNLMTHSSELCDGTSPYWKTPIDIKRQFEIYAALFQWWNENGVTPTTMSEFTEHWRTNLNRSSVSNHTDAIQPSEAKECAA